jgi:hypothetical protein
MADKRQRSALGAVDEFVGQFDREPDRKYGKRRPSTSSETHDGDGTPAVSAWKASLAAKLATSGWTGWPRALLLQHA